MNALASVLSATAAPTSATSAGARPAEGDTSAPGGFAQCIAQACEAHGAPTADEGTAIDEPTASGAPADAQAAAPASEAPAAPDLATLLPGWTAAPPVAAATPDPTGDSPAMRQGADKAAAIAARTLALPAADAPAAMRESATPTPTSAALPTPVEHGGDLPLPMPREAAARALAEPRAAAAESATPASPGVVPSTAPATPPVMARVSESALPMAHLPAPIDTPAFAPALATQVRWWAQDGVQQAQLTLSPPEMGPVTVKIVLHEQREARIDFVADVAATRSALEGAMPVLAAALDESGLKLTGGGVHDGAAQRQALWQKSQQQLPHGATRPTPGEGTAAIGELASSAGLARASAGRGLVDLVA